LGTTTKTGRGTRARSTKNAIARPPRGKRAAAKPSPARAGGSKAARKGAVEKAVEKDLKQLRLVDAGLGATALELARQLDDKETPATAKATCARALVRSLERVRELTPSFEDEKPPAKEKDKVDDLAARRAARRRKADA
jgi:hypothetical protein